MIQWSILLNVNPEGLGKVENIVELFFGEHVNCEYIVPDKSMAEVKRWLKIHGLDIKIGVAITFVSRKICERNRRNAALSA